MEILETGEGRESAVTASREGQVLVDRFEAALRFEEREEEEKVEAAMALYEKAARARMSPEALTPPTDPEVLEELEAQSQRLKLQQKCQDIAALILADEQDLLPGGLDEDED